MRVEYQCLKMQFLSNLDTNNELIIGFWAGADILSLYMGGVSYHLPAKDDSLLDSLMIGWHRHCWSWESGGSFKVCYIIHYSIDKQ